ncbi:hypothetical protein HSBAA_23380 [Vreelandella sulfidaeris]|uniref:Uncharacterized protein n=1 Tax=Vreelandella sulfidaeris TaxID=115553 RepID=A0A455U4M4_9GAMM|nr:hypothetical protein HSBAA_23380 [Halomonas sulfidaeris]
MLEWYRPQFTLNKLIEESTTLIMSLLPSYPGPVVQHRYRELFHTHLEIDPLPLHWKRYGR